jgi:hypothetical protein
MRSVSGEGVREHLAHPPAAQQHAFAHLLRD